MKFDKVLDSGEREEFSTGSRRDTRKGKGRPDLISAWGLMRLAHHYENGAVKYGDHNWTKGQPTAYYLESMFRHLIKFLGGCRDEDHLAAIVWNAFALMDHQERIARGMLDPALDTLKDFPVVFPPGEFDVKKESSCPSSTSPRSASASKPSDSSERSPKASSRRRKKNSRSSRRSASRSTASTR